MQNETLSEETDWERFELDLSDVERATLRLAARIQRETPRDFARRAAVEAASKIVQERQPGVLPQQPSDSREPA